MAMPIELICLDADDTLWHNMRFFDAAEQAFLDMLRPFEDARIVRETREASEARNLKLYGYGAKGFTLSMIETAQELVGDTVLVADATLRRVTSSALARFPAQIQAGPAACSN